MTALANAETRLNVAVTAASRAAQSGASLQNQLAAAQRRAALSGLDQAGKVAYLRQELQKLQQQGDTTTRGQIALANAQTRLNNAMNVSSNTTTRWSHQLGVLSRTLSGVGVAIGTAQILRFGVDAGKAANLLERTEATTRKLAGSTSNYANVLALAKKNQDIFGGSLQTSLAGLRGLIPVANATNVSLEKLNRTAQLLTVVDPTQDSGGAIIALRELLTADSAEGARSLAERYELPRKAIQALIATSVDAEARLQGLQDILAAQGITFEAITAQVNTTAQAYTNLGAAWSDFTVMIGKSLTANFAPFAKTLTGFLLLATDTSKGIEMIVQSELEGIGMSDALAQANARAVVAWLQLHAGLTPVVEEVKQFSYYTNLATQGIGANTAALSQLTGTLKGIEQGIETVNLRMAELALTIARAEIALYPLEDAVKQASDALDAQRDAVEAAEQALQPYRDAVEAAADAVDDQKRRIKEAEDALKPFKDAVKDAQDQLDEQRDALKRAEQGLQQYKDAVTDAQRAVDAQERAIELANRGLRDEQQAVEDAERAVRDQERALRDAEAGLDGYRDAVDAANRAVAEQQRALDAAEKELEPYRDAVDAANRAVTEQQRALDAAEKALQPYRDAVSAAQDAVETQQRAINQAERALRPYEQAVKDSQKALDAQKKATDAAKESLDAQNKSLEEAKQRLEEWANVPLTGSRAFSDKLFDLDQQTAELQLKLLNLRIGKDDHVMSPLEKQLQAVNDQVQETTLRLSGLRADGGSANDVADAEALYKRLRGQQDALSTRVAREEPSNDPAVNAVEAEIQRLQDEAERTRLQEKISLDPLRRQQDALGGLPKEMSFDDIVQGYQKSQQEVDTLTTSVAKATGEWENQSASLDTLTAAHERNVAALEAQREAIEPLREQLLGLQDSLQGAQDALKGADDALDPLRKHLDDLKGVADAAKIALEGQEEALQPLREQLDALRGIADAAKVALEGQEQALQPLRDRLKEVEDNARAANDELARQEAIIQPLIDALVPLKDALVDANWQLSEQDRLLNPLRESISGYEEALQRANQAYKDANEAIDPLREQLDRLATAQDNANRALRDRDKLIDSAREKERLLEGAYKDQTDKLNDAREAIVLLQRQEASLRLTENTLKFRADAATKALEDFDKQMKTTADKSAAENARMKADFDQRWGEWHAGSIPATTKAGSTAVKQGIIGSTADVMAFLNGTDGGGGALGAMQRAFDQTFTNIKSVTIGHFTALKTQSLGQIDELIGKDDTSNIGMLGKFGFLSFSLMNPEGGRLVGMVNEGIKQFRLWAEGAGTQMSALVGDYDAGTGALGWWRTLYDGIFANAPNIQNAILGAFTGASALLPSILTGMHRIMAIRLNNQLATLEDHGKKFIGAVNTVSEWLIGRKVLNFDFTVPRVTVPDLPPPVAQPGLAVGTDNWQGGWARTGERGKRELAILPGGPGSEGNLTYLPKGAAVLPNDETEKWLRRLPGFESGLNTGIFTPGASAPPAYTQRDVDAASGFLDWFKNGSQALIERGIAAVGGSTEPTFKGLASEWGPTIGVNFMRFGMRKVYDIADGWLHDNLPKVLADNTVRLLQKGGDYWGFLGGRTEGAQPGAGVPAEVAGDYPTGIGLSTALGAILDGGRISGYRFSAGHPGIDIAGSGGLGQAIRALIGGRVLRAGYNPALEGQYIVTQDEIGRGAYYGHMVPGSERYGLGQLVGRGSTIGGMGKSGAAQGVHVHFEMRLNGVSVNPEDVFAGRFKWPFGPDVRGDVPIVVPGLDAFWPGTPSNAQTWLMQAVQGAGVGADWLRGMSILGRYESGWNPNAIAFSRDDYNAIHNNHSRGLAQTIPDTFNANKRPGAMPYLKPFGHVPQFGPGGYDTTSDPGDIYSPVENLIASIKYIRGKYGHVTALPGYASVNRGEGWIGYAHGGMINEPIWGIGASGQGYMFGEQGAEMIVPLRDTINSMDSRLQGMHPQSWNTGDQPIIVQPIIERHEEIHAHYSEYQSENSLRKDMWIRRQLDPRG